MIATLSGKRRAEHASIVPVSKSQAPCARSLPSARCIVRGASEFYIDVKKMYCQAPLSSQEISPLETHDGTCRSVDGRAGRTSHAERPRNPQRTRVRDGSADS